MSRAPRTPVESRAERRRADREHIKQAIAALKTSEGWQRWLQVRAVFRDYSFANTLLIAHQCPEATRVAGFRAWLKLGYCVRKGEHAIRIWAPSPPSKRALEKWREAGADQARRPRTYFRLVPVFDRSQVDPLPEHPGGPKPLEPPHQPIEGDALDRLRQPLTDLATDLGCEVRFEPITVAAGYHDPVGARIVVDNSPYRSPNAEIQTLVHELSHLLIRAERHEGDPELTYRSEEVVVESVAYSVCASLGLDTGGDSVPYIAGWSAEGAPDSIERYAELIDRLAQRIEAAIKTPEREPTQFLPAARDHFGGERQGGDR